MADHSLKIDENAKPDLDFLAHLRVADLIVTNEKGFMKQAFDKLWRPKRKALMTTAEFVAYLDKL